MITRKGRQFSVLLHRMVKQRHRGEVLITAIITIFFLSAVLICQYRCFEIEQANCRQAERQMVRAIHSRLHDLNQRAPDAVKATRQGLSA